jgi:hypothetical protein
MLKFQAQIYRINDIIGWYDRRELTLTPDFQRRRVWSPRGRSYLIDSIIKGIPLPQFFLREKVLVREKRTVREVVDGQQRISAIIDYINGKFSVLPVHNKEFARAKYDELPEEIQAAFLSYPLSVNILQGTEDADVLEIFSRINSYSVPLNRQEKLNAIYVGAFKKEMDELAKIHLAYWKRHKIISPQAIARMRDVEFTCELVAAMLEGLQNQKNIIPSLYKKYDDVFEQIVYLAERYADILAFCERLLNEDISATEFQKVSLFYSLYAAVYDLKYGFGSDGNTPERNENTNGFEIAQQNIFSLNEALTQEQVPEEQAVFYEATRQSTDKINQRSVRHDYLKALLRPCFT